MKTIAVKSIKGKAGKNTLTDPKPKKEKSQVAGKKGKRIKTDVTIKAFPELNKIIIYLTNGGGAEQLENDSQLLLTYLKEKYNVVKVRMNNQETGGCL